MDTNRRRFRKWMITADKQLWRGFRWVNRSFIGSTIIKAICAVILALLIAYLTNAFTSLREEQKIVRDQQAFVASVGIGYNKEYVDAALGYPFQSYVDANSGIEDCCYQIHQAQFRAYYFDDVLKGFFVTLEHSSAIGMYTINNINDDWFAGTIGEYNFDGIYDEFGDRYCGHFGAMYQMLPRYMEEYYIPGVGASCCAIFAVLPHGIFIVPVKSEANMVEHYDDRYWQWGGNYPNTWGMVDQHWSLPICSLLFDNDTYQQGFYSLYDAQEHEYMDTHNQNKLHIYYEYDKNYDPPTDPNWFGEAMTEYQDSILAENDPDEGS